MLQELTREEKVAACPSPLQSLIQEFQMAEPRERLEMLLDFALGMPDLPDWLAAKRDSMEQVHECQTPVFVFTQLEGDCVRVYIDAPQESPTVRGYAAIVQEGLDRATPDALLQTPDDVHYLLGLHEALTPQRMRGLHALIAYIKRQVTGLGTGD